MRSISFSPDGKTLASASDDKTIKLWNLTANKALATLTDSNSVIALCRGDGSISGVKVNSY
ncbi:hypothetical protein F7734_15735 [Scytonema sp. UIC 10036]|uniref:hypothetical protein n=1 Tax=Scytonema sp. UIC 10036 TaxID=2304196 RepID=UPI001385B9E7|nr:hypothetical protein [Scytonema sp. UIC 10036]